MRHIPHTIPYLQLNKCQPRSMVLRPKVKYQMEKGIKSILVLRNPIQNIHIRFLSPHQWVQYKIITKGLLLCFGEVPDTNASEEERVQKDRSVIRCVEEYIQVLERADWEICRWEGYEHQSGEVQFHSDHSLLEAWLKVVIIRVEIWLRSKILRLLLYPAVSHHNR